MKKTWLIVGLVVAGVVTGIVVWKAGSGEEGESVKKAVALPEQAPGEGNADRKTTETAGTAKMVALLEKASRAKNAYDSEWMVEVLGREIEQAATMDERFHWMGQLPQQLLNAGRPMEALAELDQLEAKLAEAGKKEVLESSWSARQYLRGMCHLRMGEQANCILNHSIDSCLLPIRGAGVHADRRGSTAAIEHFMAILRANPDDGSARWLLNLAHMTLGDHPEGVPPEWLIEPSAFESDYAMPRFVDVAGDLGVDVNDLSGGVVLDDFDNDGLLDLMVSSMALGHQMRFFINHGEKGFEDRTEEAGLIGLTGGLNLAQADYNNDGFVDVLVLRGAWFGREGRHPNSLLRNNGDGTFEDVTEEAGLLSFYPTQTATWFDYNGDGWIDVFIGNESDGSNRARCEMYHNNGDGTFAEVSSGIGLRYYGFVKAVVSADYNNDGRPDLFISHYGGQNSLFRNDGPVGNGWSFTDITEEAGVGAPAASFPGWFFDYDNDGWEDLFVAGYDFKLLVGEVTTEYVNGEPRGAPAYLYRNQGDGSFTNVSESVGLNKVLMAMGVNYGDLDHDGWLDFYAGTGTPDMAMLIPNRMFRNAEGNGFQDVTTAGGFGHLQKGHGIAFGDVDNDGDQDVYSVMGGAYSGDVFRNALFANPGHDNHSVVLRLVGKKANRAAIGARIRVVVSENGQERSIYRTVRSGGSFGASPLRQEIGLGQADSIQRIDIEWPGSGTRQTLRDVPMERFFEVHEGSEQLIELAPPRFKIDVKS